MENDLYTKIVLTVIAACLLFSAVKSSFSPREATAQKAQPVYVEGGHVTVDGTIDVNKVRSEVTVKGAVNISSPYKESFKEIMRDIDVVNVRVINPW
jgi:DNA/RNA endonuclease YhcR with UshA esterase domain